MCRNSLGQMYFLKKGQFSLDVSSLEVLTRTLISVEVGHSDIVTFLASTHNENFSVHVSLSEPATDKFSCTDTFGKAAIFNSADNFSGILELFLKVKTGEED